MRRSPTARSILFCAILLAGGLISLRNTSQASGGCSRAEDHAPSFGECVSMTGSICYYCEYANPGGGYTVCGEDESGSVARCIDYQDLPPYPFG